MENITNNKIENKNINWENFSGDFFTLQDNEPTDLVLSKWEQMEHIFGEEKKIGISFTILEVDGKETQKNYAVFSKRFINILKPIILETEKKGQPSFKIRVTKTGLGMNTNYSVKRL